MKIAVIAAQGRSGQAFVNEALNAGHRIKAGIRGDNPFESHPRLEIIQCDATDKFQIKKLIEQSDAVVSMIGHVKGSDAQVQTKATEVVIAAMTAGHLTRFVSLTGTGARVSGDQPSLIDKILNAVIAKIDPNRIEDGKNHLEVLQESSLDYTVLRVLKLTNGGAGSYTLTFHGPAKLFTSRREVAKATLEVLENNTFIRDYPIIAAH